MPVKVTFEAKDFGLIPEGKLKKNHNPDLFLFGIWNYRKKPTPEAQPDNRDGNEVCIGVLNNFYADGIKWHDVSCHHRKPTICEL